MRLTVAIASALILALSAVGRAQDASEAVAWGEAQNVFTAKLSKVETGPVGRSMPPMRVYTLHLNVQSALRGTLSGDVQCSYVVRQVAEPAFKLGALYIVAADRVTDRLSAVRIEAADDSNLPAAQRECSVPLGWQLGKDGVISPWSTLGERAWAKESGTLNATRFCKTTGRPMLLAGPQAEFSVEKVPPAKEIEWTNPDGDGEYKITVSNPTDKPLLVPALLQQDGNILWKESLVIICQTKAYVCPGASGVKGAVQSVTLKPGQSVATTINALELNGPEWPQGGYRIEFKFCLGEKGQTESFYYMSRYHDPLRAKLQSH